ncbi:MAG: hypothetical protein LUG85_09540 [Clostridiales bacterium]|nr:hypothetical protein [Clostridiales bacterium]MCD7828758.1 hypothetical protein [Clostridiales bacterium]
MSKNEDYDIKIFSPAKAADETEPVVIADEMKRQVISGNIQKAKKLGKDIADSFPQAAEKKELINMAKDCGVDLTRMIKDQAIILSVFTAEYCIDRSMPSILSTTATSMLYDTLIEDSPDLYNNLLSSTAFSFYYMNLKSNKVSSEDIGVTFSMLCGDKNSSALRCYGQTVFEHSFEEYKNSVEAVDFAD